MYLCEIPEHYILEDDSGEDWPKYEMFLGRESLAEAQKGLPYSCVYVAPCMTSQELEWFAPFVRRYGEAFVKLWELPWDAQKEIIDACDAVADIDKSWLPMREVAENYVGLIERILGNIAGEPESYSERTVLPLICKALRDCPAEREAGPRAKTSGEGISLAFGDASRRTPSAATETRTNANAHRPDRAQDESARAIGR